MELKQGTLLQNGKYRIVRFISSGGFGCTYEALHTMFDEKVAIKEFFVKDFCNRDEKTSHVTVGTQVKKALVEKLKRKFVEEAKVLYKMKHHGIVKVKDIFEENGTAYYVMDYIEGKSLRDIVMIEGTLSESVALKYIREVSTALDYVHSQNRLHLDIKPGNIMIDENEHAILIDFGTSKQYDEESGENTSTLMGKTPGYAPLEQMGNELVQFYPATDIYALGATLYNMLTGKMPLSATRMASGEEMEDIPEHISAKTRQAIELSMQLNRKKRPQCIAEFIEILGETPTFNNQNYFHNSNYSYSSRTSIDEDTIIIGVPYGSNKINGHEYVDLGLPSGIKWATCNVGADSPEDYGDYFAWGEVKPKKEYSEYNYKHVNISEESVFLGLGKREIKNYFNIGDNISGTEYDAASANWGGSWRLPTKAECEELNNKCTWKWTTKKRVRGYNVTGPNGNSIFLPAAGCRLGSSLGSAGELGYYWSSTPDESNGYSAYDLSFNSWYHRVSWHGRYDGQSVRPVSE